MTDVLEPAHPNQAVRDAEVASPPAAPRRAPRRVRLPSAVTVMGFAVAVLCSMFVLSRFGLELLLANTTPAGGDMGAHVWGPAYLRDHLLPQLRLSGWTPDWYAGFPAYHFYMVIPPLAIVALNAGFGWAVGVPLAVVGLASALAATRGGNRRWRPWALAVAAVAAVLLIAVPYGVAFKLVSVSGVVLMPLAAWAMGRLLRAREPVPPMLAVATLPFLFDTNFTIYGGNIASTLAGEFSFSISLMLCLVAIGLVGRGMDDGRHRVAGAVVLALAGLCHVIPVFFVVFACGLLVVLGRTMRRLWWVAGGASAALATVGWSPEVSGQVRWWAMGQFVAVVAVLLATQREARVRTAWLAVTGVVAVLLASFWMLAFVAREPYMNHMGWERLEGSKIGAALLTTPMEVALPVAALGFVLSLVLRQRLGVLLGVLAAISASLVANVPETRLWNARILPFFYLSVYLLAAVGLALAAWMAASWLSQRWDRPDRRLVAATPVVALVAALVAVSMPLRALPYGSLGADGSYRWLGLVNRTQSFVPGWIRWNYSGYERKDAYREYHGIVATMADVGAERGCGRSTWEYDSSLDRYGTPMALMLLPFWTDGCIGSMEGLYFESSETTPFHFLNSSVLSENPSRPQRDLPYRAFDSGEGFDLGVRQLQTLGVRYYLALSDVAIAAARAHPELTELAESPPWVVFEVADSELVEPVEHLPVVVTGASIVNAVEGDRFRVGWRGEAVRLFNDPAAPTGVLPAEDGPSSWPRAELVSEASMVPVDPVRVGDIDADTDSVSFTVDRTGVPVLVKISYFPNWQASGAEGPWRVGPNLMAVVPTSNEVTLTYGRTAVDWLAWLLTAVGAVSLFGLACLDRRRARPGSPAAEPLEPRAPLPTGVDPGTVGPDRLALSVVMPAFNEEVDLEPAVREVVAGLRARSYDFEVLVVENGSVDATAAIAERLAAELAEVRALSWPEPDYGRALRAGLLAAGGRTVVNFDVDYFDLDFLDAAVAMVDAPDGPDVVVGTKRGDGAVDTRAWYRRLVTAGYVTVLRVGFGLAVSDTHGIKAMRRRPLAALAATCRSGTDLFDTELVLRAERAGLRSAEIPVVVVERRASRTSILRRLPRTLRGLVGLRIALLREAGSAEPVGQPPGPALHAGSGAFGR